jgi:hypothetical protein
VDRSRRGRLGGRRRRRDRRARQRRARLPRRADGGALPAATAPPPPPAPSCPAAEIDPAPSGSIARRWNEQILGAIRRDMPRPGVHARNLFHLSVALWDAWAAYDATADGYVVEETRVAPPADLAAARQEAISYAAYRVLSHRYGGAVGGTRSARTASKFMAELGYPTPTRPPTGARPARGRQPHRRRDHRRLRRRRRQRGRELRRHHGLELGQPAAGGRSPGHTCASTRRSWQPLNLAEAETQNGIVLPPGVQGYIGSNWRAVTPFALRRRRRAPYFDLGPAAAWDQPEMKDWVTQVVAAPPSSITHLTARPSTSPRALRQQPARRRRRHRPPAEPDHRAALPGQRRAARRLHAACWPSSGPTARTPRRRPATGTPGQHRSPTAPASPAGSAASAPSRSIRSPGTSRPVPRAQRRGPRRRDRRVGAEARLSPRGRSRSSATWPGAASRATRRAVVRSRRPAAGARR